MSVTGVFAKGRPTGHPSATAILKYIPRPRVPWQPSRFNRGNLDEADLSRMWGLGRYRDGPGNYNSGYSTEKTKTLEDNPIGIIPKHELEKYMPDISLGPKALVTPVSLMSARNGHRVTHDMIHSYDPYIGRVQKPAVVDHDNITVEDPNHVGLNAATLDSRGRIYRWLRRGPFFQEDHYFRRSTSLTRHGTVPVSAQEAPLMAKIVRLARQGHLKAACEEYRRVTTTPPVAVYRALTAACIPGAKLADAVAIFEDGNARLFYVARDGEVLSNLMRCAIRAKHRVRVMWVYNVMRGRFYENVVVRAEVDPIWRFRVAFMALEYLLDTNAGEEARAVHAYLVEEKLLNCDVHVRVGHIMRTALLEGKTIMLNDEVKNGVALVRNAEAVAPQVAAMLYKRYVATLRDGCVGPWADRPLLSDPAPTAAKPGASAEWLQVNFPDIDVLAILRLARFRRLTRDLMAKDRAAYVERAAQWVELLSTAHQTREEAPLTYMRKSRPSLTGNPNLRVAWVPEGSQQHHTLLLAHEEGFTFHFGGEGSNTNRSETRLVEETFRYAGDTLQSRYLAQQPIHREVSAAIPLQEVVMREQAQQHAGQRLLHSSVTSELHSSVGPGGSSTGAARGTSLVSGARTAVVAEGGSSGAGSSGSSSDATPTF